MTAFNWFIIHFYLSFFFPFVFIYKGHCVPLNNVTDWVYRSVPHFLASKEMPSNIENLHDSNLQNFDQPKFIDNEWSINSITLIFFMLLVRLAPAFSFVQKQLCVLLPSPLLAKEIHDSLCNATCLMDFNVAISILQEWVVMEWKKMLRIC